MDRRVTPVSTVFVRVVMLVESVWMKSPSGNVAEGKRVLGPRIWNHHKTFQT